MGPQSSEQNSSPPCTPVRSFPASTPRPGDLAAGGSPGTCDLGLFWFFVLFFSLTCKLRDLRFSSQVSSWGPADKSACDPDVSVWDPTSWPQGALCFSHTFLLLLCVLCVLSPLCGIHSCVAGGWLSLGASYPCLLLPVPPAMAWLAEC